MIWENLEYLLDSYKKNGTLQLSYLGRRFSNLLPKGYNSGGAGYLMSRQAAYLIIHEGPKKSGCLKQGGIEDYEIGRYSQFVYDTCVVTLLITVGVE